jgi:hypothetical protein
MRDFSRWERCAGKKQSPLSESLRAFCFSISFSQSEHHMSFKFELDQTAQVKASGEAGEVIGRAEYSATENSYLLRYKAADGRAVEAWWGESALVSDE